ncbi:twin-arginine translocase TatA/TatE family subunit [Chrysiogenes arsenatis]|uniref:twin-arginine translocase TatA/TatE family subunit n=1 Tax=Chrysiogenes arsenatis TaxID=309797 RepID=UPI00041863DD|nr:twin-arginine translocase TatA/TatE family subunit [Chrysiogenes arsenatis]
MFGLGVWELAIILVIVLVIFGAGKLPQIGAGLGKGIRNFKDSVKTTEDEAKGNIDQSTPTNNNKTDEKP